jgi:hypothetical protein
MAPMAGMGSSGVAVLSVVWSRAARAWPAVLAACLLWLGAPAGVVAAQTTPSGGGAAGERAALRALERDHLVGKGASGAATGGAAAPGSATTPGAGSGAATAPGSATTPGAGAGAATTPGSSAATAPGATAGTTTTTASTATTASTVAPAAPTGAAGAAPSAHAGSTTVSTPAIALAALAAILILLSLAWALARALAYEPSWMPALRHSFAEAGLRVSATFAELGDWLRIGR